MDNLSEQIDKTIAEKLGSTETVYGESIQRAAEDERLQLQINELNSNYTALGNSLSTLNTTVNGKQDTLVAGNNIKNISDGTNTVSLLGAGDVRFKTINGQSIIGSDDIEVSSGECDCAYQVIVKITLGGNSPVYEVIKGDYATAKNKMENGEYVDFKVFTQEQNVNNVRYHNLAVEYINLFESSITLRNEEYNLLWDTEGIWQIK